MKTWQVIVLVVLVGVIVYYATKKPAAPTTSNTGSGSPARPESGGSERTNPTTPVQTISYGVSPDTSDPLKCHFVKFIYLNGAVVGTYEVSESEFVNSQGGWGAICANPKFQGLSCIHNKCQSQKQ